MIAAWHFRRFNRNLTLMNQCNATQGEPKGRLLRSSVVNTLATALAGELPIIAAGGVDSNAKAAATRDLSTTKVSS